MPRLMTRGAVYLADIELPHGAVGGTPGSTVHSKLMVILQGGQAFANQRDVAVVLASSRDLSANRRPFEVFVGPAEGFLHETVIDGRWVHTFVKTDIPEIERLFTLIPAVMDEISNAITAGLQL